jgi:hypothetical protein
MSNPIHDIQIGGTHYKDMDIEPWEAMDAWSTIDELIGYHKNTAIAYLARHRRKGGYTDIRKAHHHLTKLVALLDADQDERE